MKRTITIARSLLVLLVVSLACLSLTRGAFSAELHGQHEAMERGVVAGKTVMAVEPASLYCCSSYETCCIGCISSIISLGTKPPDEIVWAQRSSAAPHFQANNSQEPDHPPPKCGARL
ncbi:MAG: hypothetical protein R3F54_31525 [Alphaproteobacteria bacterium]